MCSFDYGIVVFKRRFNITASPEEYTGTVLERCIRLGIEYKYTALDGGRVYAQMQILCRDDTGNPQCICLDMRDWSFRIEHLGDMQCIL